MAPLGVAQIVAAVAGAQSALDAGCGSARLTVALAEAGIARVVGIDTSAERLAQGRARLAEHPLGDRVQLVEADFDRVLPFPDAHFDAAVSRLALMIAAVPVATLRELRRVTSPGGRIVTAIWSPVTDNPWFALPRAAAQAVVGERADYARVFGRLGAADEAAQVHCAAGLRDVHVEMLRRTLDVEDAGALWNWMVAENGHVRRLDAGSASRSATPSCASSSGSRRNTAHPTDHSAWRARSRS